ncbi:BTAD domain-containing putative transcriptional regulator [Deinococcus yavapaiensis]|nr:BTAD domain-containing putative transcriptional regulator [Deinococcus yavapaiensis]
MTGSSDWRFTLLGSPQLIAPDGRFIRCEGKTLALLAYLAVEGATSRARLVSLLWPETEESAARNNLVHLLRRLRKACGASLVPGHETLALGPEVRTDIADVQDHSGAYEAGDALPDGAFLDGVDYDDLPDLADWLLAAREQFSMRRLQSYHRRIDRLQAAGRVSDAIAVAERLLVLDPLSEETWRTLMRLHSHAGDRPAALRAYRRCKDLLRRELDAEPSAPTARLAREIDLGVVNADASDGRLPIAVLRPPRLVGRDVAWAEMEDAWAAGKQIFVFGDPGAGKTRLAQDFLRSKGTWLYLPSRPGDRDVPFMAAARNARARLAAAPDAALSPWVRRELSRLLPELRDDDDLAPLGADSERYMFFLAHLEMVRATASTYQATLNDDIQYYDSATMDLGAFMFSHVLAEGSGPSARFISVCRRGELTSHQEVLIERLVMAGLAVRVDLTPLEPEDVVSLLRDLPLPESLGTRLPIRDLAARLHEYGGGNPQFVLEAIRHVIETGDVETLLEPKRLTRGHAALVERRLARLSSAALQVARAAAVLRADFTLEQISEVLGVTVFDTANAWEELDAAQVVAGESFSHDLVAEAILTSTPAHVRKLLHRAAARVLARYDAAPARVARQWLDGGDAGQSAPWWLRAARAAEETLRFREATEFYAAAAEAFDKSADMEAADRARREQARVTAAMTSVG